MMADYFFFQAEDGIRDGTVTGVQTCALPICASSGTIGTTREPILSSRTRLRSSRANAMVVDTACWLPPRRSEERRVGKECRSRCSAYHQKSKAILPDVQYFIE